MTPRRESMIDSFAFLLLSSSAVRGQYTTASLAGTVSDASGALVPGSTVTVKNVGTGLVKSVLTTENGSFLLAALPVGEYRLTTEKSGFATYVQEGIKL